MATERSKPVIVVLAGGTGGHIFPALSVAELLKNRGYHIHWIGTKSGMEADLVPAHGFDITFLPVKGIVGKGIKGIIQAPVRVLVSVVQSLRIMRQLSVVGVVGMGGFVTGPGSIAARILGKPLIIHEQNAIAGLTNKIVSHFATLTLAAFPGAFGENKNVLVTGNPTRSTIRLDLRTSPIHSPMRMLVLGGSRGALAINRLIPKILQKMLGDLEVWHQTGRDHFELMEAEYKVTGVSAKLVPFIDDMKAAYDWADIVLCRSGALTVSELANVAKPSLLVPYPWHKDQQQLLNANYLAEKGAALVIEQSSLTVSRIVNILEQLMREPDRLMKMSRSAVLCASPDATEKVATVCQEVINESRHGE